ncbi:MAG: RNA-binding protein [Patescibacteria group bacterium]
MSTKLFVGNLPFKMTDDELNQLFAEFGSVTSANVLTDRETGRSRGFGFVEFETEEQAKAAIAALDQKEIEGRNIKVDIARPPKEY